MQIPESGRRGSTRVLAASVLYLAGFILCVFAVGLLSARLPPQRDGGNVVAPFCRFAGGYTPLGVLTIATAILLLRGKETHTAIQMVALYVCTIVVGGRIWATWFAIGTGPSFLDRSGLFLDGDLIASVAVTSLLVAWAFSALAGHCFISAFGALAQQWNALRNRAAVFLCGVTLCVGLLCPLALFRAWQQWLSHELPRLAASCAETRRLTDDLTRQMAKEYPDDLAVHLARANYLLDVGLGKEAREEAEIALRLVPPEQTATKNAIRNKMMRTAESAEH